MASILPLNFNSSSLFTKNLETILSAPITIGLSVKRRFHIFSALWQDPSICLSICFLFLFTAS